MSYVSAYFHCVFSTKERRRLISPACRKALAVSRRHRAAEQDEGHEIGGVEDHVHILLSLPSTMPISKAMQLIKGGSSKWVHETFPNTGCLHGRRNMARSV